MVNTCIIHNCGLTGENSGFFKIPNNENVRQLWVNQLHLSDYYLKTKKLYRVCYRHFPTEAFKTSGKYLTLHKGIILYHLWAIQLLIGRALLSNKINSEQ